MKKLTKSKDKNRAKVGHVFLARKAVDVNVVEE